MKICIIGCGPSGLLAAHACSQKGHKLTIVSDVIKQSQMGGAMYLHKAIPGLTGAEPDAQLWISKRGLSTGYAKKVYGDEDHPVSWDQFVSGAHNIWYMDSAYNELWRRFGRFIKQLAVTEHTMDEIIRHFDLVIATMPKPTVCYNDDHTFDSVPVWIKQKSLTGAGYPNVMIYSGLEKDPWYRKSTIHNIVSIEYAHRPTSGSYIAGMKPTRNNCDCWRRVMWAGRWGQWEKGVLIHHVYKQVSHALQQL
jgi:hypothetical protein